MKASRLGPAGLAVAAILLLCAILPPDVMGSSYAGLALFTLIAVAAAAARSPGTAPSGTLLAFLPLAGFAVHAAIAPGEAVEPVATIVLATLAGIAAITVAGETDTLVRLLAGLLAVAGARALYEALFGLAAWAARMKEAAPAGDAAALLTRLEGGRPYGGFQTPAALGCFLVMTIPIVTVWAMGRTGKARALGLAASGIGLAGLAATRSITAIAALGCATLLAGVRGRVSARVLAVVAAAVALLALAAGLARPDSVFSLGRADSPLRLRSGNVRIALEIARDHPLAGVGPGGYAEAYPQYRRASDNEARHAHDLPAELLAEWGFPAGIALTAVFFWVFLAPLVATPADTRSAAFGIAIGIGAFAIQNLADYTAFLPSLLVVAAILRGLIAKRPLDAPVSGFARAGWVTLGLSVALIGAGCGLSREALFRARSAAALGDHALALEEALKAGIYAPWDADPPLMAAQARIEAHGSSAAALDDADRAVSKAPTRAVARWARARARGLSGDDAGAYADLFEAARLNPLRSEYASQRDAVGAALAAAAAGASR